MDYRQIQTFLAVAKYKNMTTVGEHLYITQSTVSYRIKCLEDELNTVLINRKKGTGNITLTDQGINFIKIAQEWMDVYQKTQEFVQRDKKVQIRIAAPECIHYLFKNRYYEIRESYPNCRLVFLTRPSDQIKNIIQQGRADIGFSYSSESIAGVDIKEIDSFPLMIAERSLKPRPRSSISFGELDFAKGVVFEGFDFWKNITEQMHGIRVDEEEFPYIEIDNSSMLKSVFMEENWCILPEFGKDTVSSLPNIHFYSFSGVVPRIPYYALTSSDADELTNNVIEMIK